MNQWPNRRLLSESFRQDDCTRLPPIVHPSLLTQYLSPRYLLPTTIHVKRLPPSVQFYSMYPNPVPADFLSIGTASQLAPADEFIFPRQAVLYQKLGARALVDAIAVKLLWPSRRPRKRKDLDLAIVWPDLIRRLAIRGGEWLSVTHRIQPNIYSDRHLLMSHVVECF